MSIPPELSTAPILTWDGIRFAADETRRDYLRGDACPVDVFAIEFTSPLKVTPQKNLVVEHDTEALLRIDLTGITVDESRLMNPAFLNRVRFSIAHEIGHWILHSAAYIAARSFNTEEDVVDYHRELAENQYRWFERQANEFAGRLLVPRERLIAEFWSPAVQDMLRQLQSEKYPYEASVLRDLVAGEISPVFQVSDAALARRLLAERLMPA